MGYERCISGSIRMLKNLMPLVDSVNCFFKFHARIIVSASIAIVVATLCVLTTMLIHEYHFFKRETEKMLGHKEDYRNYVIAVKKILHDYNKTKARLEELETLVAEKKNEFEDIDGLSGNAVFPATLRVYSSDDEDDQERSSFLVINRELEYLKQSTLDYLRAQNLSYLENRIGPDVWRDYTDQVIDHHKEQAQKKRAHRLKRVSTKKQRKPYEKQVSREISPKAKQFINEMHMAWPIDRSSFWMSSPFGPRRKPNGARGFHTGIDMAAVRNTPVKAAASGVVVQANYASGYGNTVVIAHTGKYRTRYAHLNSFSVAVGQKVERGEQIGKVGATGCVRSKRRGGDASHLHFEVYAFGKHVNPIYFLG